MAVILVGALFVGSMETVHCGEINPPPRPRKAPVVIDRGNGRDFARGEELGRFNMGSTVVLLFQRDRHLCCYCGNRKRPEQLTRDHIVPLSRGGRDHWKNVVTACKPCNQRKGARTPERAGMLMLYVPYTPSLYEALILRNRRILADQMDFLVSLLPADSRLVA